MDKNINFFELDSRYDVARILNIEEDSLRYFLYGIRPDNMYKEYTVPKGKGGVRTISSPNKKLKMIQRKLNKVLSEVYKVKPSSYGFVLGRNCIKNAQNHNRKKYVLNIDLKDFFTQIHFGRIKGMLEKEPYNIGKEAALVVAQIVCYKGKLPQGAPTSPIISNMICSPLDTQLTKLAKKYKLVYTRYADDITFSTYKNEFPEEIAYLSDGEVILGDELIEIINRNSFEINMEKISLRNKHERQEVTGLVVNEFVNVKREYINKIRAILHNCEKNGIYRTAIDYVKKGLCDNKEIKTLSSKSTIGEDDIKKIELWFENVLKGKISFIGNVRGTDNKLFVKYAKQMNKIFQKEIFLLEKQIEFIRDCSQLCVILESTDKEHPCQGTGFFMNGYGLLTNAHVTDNDAFYEVKTCTGERIGLITRCEDAYIENEELDFALYKIRDKEKLGWNLGDSSNLKIGDLVKIIGYPNYIEGDSPYVEECSITSRKKGFYGQEIFTVSGRIVHGASGGVVLNKEYEVVGIIQCGANKFDDEEESILPGFIPINKVISYIENEDMNSHK